MTSLNASLILVLLLLAWLGFSSEGEAAPTYSSHYCDNSTTFTSNSSYHANLNTLFSSLSSNAGSSRNGFYNTTAGQAPDLVYGTLLCRGDVSADLCRDCVATATNDIAQRCLNGKMGVIWYDECTVRYSDQNIFSIIREVPSTDKGSSVTIPDKDQFSQLLASVMKSLENRAAYDDRWGKRFATGEANFTSSFQTLYSLVQCTPDLSDALCFRCLQSAIAAIPMCCDGKQGGRVLLPSCNIRYEMFPFYTLNSTGAPLFPSPNSSPNSRKGRRKISPPIIIAIGAPMVITLVLLVLALFWVRRRRRTSRKFSALLEENVAEEEIIPSESLQFNFATIEAAINNFSSDNKIGEGGFGEVYKGKLSNGQEVAVKRLSKSSAHGAEQFKTEVGLLAKLQHKNLVRLLGFCLGGNEKLLIYEYVKNKSLDNFLFGPIIQGGLDWTRRYKIIGGIARGLLYLHEDSRLRIIHRDLKASNILLDDDMNAKIADFGLAKILEMDQTQANTRRIFGTYGYMSPEYAMRGQFSMKSDVFSFGVLILEIISGKSNCSFYQSDGADNFLSYSWKLWGDGTPLELIDSNLGGNYSRDDVVRCIHVALLCVQEDPARRPTMANVVIMLDSNSVSMSVPRKPGYFRLSTNESSPPQAMGLEVSDESSTKSLPLSVNEVSITEVVPR